MMNSSRLIVYFFFTFFCSSLYGQTGSVHVQNNVDNSTSEAPIQIKWYSQNVLFPEGVNVYRTEYGRDAWLKLNDAPIFRKYAISEQEVTRDSSLLLFTELIDEGGWEVFEGIGGILKMNAIIKSFSSTVYADFLGIFYEDYTSSPGKTYVYRINQYQNGREVLLAQSEPIKAGPFVPGDSLSGFVANQLEGETTIQLDWDIDESLFYGVNLYRSIQGADFVKLNDNPLVISLAGKDGVLEYPSPKYVDLDLKENITYAYYAVGVDFFNEETRPSKTVSILLEDVTPPNPPKYLDRELDTMKISLKWSPPEGQDIKEVKLFRGSSSDGPFNVIYTTKDATSYIDSLEIPGPYFYYVSSFDFSGNESKSRMVYADIKDLEPPLPPSGLAVTTDTGRYYLQWDENREADIFHYRVFRKANSRNGKGSFLLMPKFPQEASYEYRLPKNTLNAMSFYVVAVDTAGNISTPSQVVTAQMPDVVPPQMPQFRGVSTKENQITVQWYKNADADLRGYNLMRADSVLPLVYEQVNSSLLSPAVYQYTDENIEVGKSYLYSLEAIDSTGNKSNSMPYTATYEDKEEDGVSGDIKLFLKYKRRKKTNTLTWEAVQMQGALGYVVFRGLTPMSLRPVTALTQTLKYVDVGMDSEKVYYQIKAYNNQGGIVSSEKLEWKK